MKSWTENIVLSEEQIPITPNKLDLFGLQISETIITAWIVMLIIILFALVFRIFLFKKFKTIPKGLQNILEIIVEFFGKFSSSVLGKHGAAFSAYVFTVAVMIFCTSLVELFGIRAPASDLNFTIALSGISFFIINGFGLYYSGLLGRLRWFVKPQPFMLPINIVTHSVIPVSLSFRLFGNMFAGLVVMNLLYSVVYLKFVLPAIISIYFTLFHTGIQTYIFLVLTMSFMEETLAYGELHVFRKRKKENNRNEKPAV